MALQIFGTKKCRDTAKAMRFFKERGVRFQFIDLVEKPMSPGELSSVCRAVGAEALIDKKSESYAARGLAYMDYDPEEEIIANPLLLQTPVVRDGRRAVIGLDPAGWTRILGD